jgi:hypothetical protein
MTKVGARNQGRPSGIDDTRILKDIPGPDLFASAGISKASCRNQTLTAGQIRLGWRMGE